MLLIIPVLLGIVLALPRGGSVSNLARLQLRGMGAIVASFILQAVIYVPIVRDSGLVRQGNAAIYIGVLVLMFAGVARNWDLGPGLKVVLAGLALNMAAIVANGGHMPVNAAALRAVQGEAMVRTIASQQYANRMLADRSSLLLPLSDIIPLPIPFGHGSVCSLGDVLIAGGAATLAYGATRRSRKQLEATSRLAAVLPSTTQPLPIG